MLDVLLLRTSGLKVGASRWLEAFRGGARVRVVCASVLAELWAGSFNSIIAQPRQLSLCFQRVSAIAIRIETVVTSAHHASRGPCDNVFDVDYQERPSAGAIAVEVKRWRRTSDHAATRLHQANGPRP